MGDTEAELGTVHRHSDTRLPGAVPETRDTVLCSGSACFLPSLLFAFSLCFCIFPRAETLKLIQSLLWGPLEEVPDHLPQAAGPHGAHPGLSPRLCSQRNCSPGKASSPRPEPHGGRPWRV